MGTPEEKDIWVQSNSQRRVALFQLQLS